MRSTKIKYTAAALLFLQLFTGVLLAQNLPRESIASHLSERFLLAGENLWFSVMVSNQHDLPGKQISNRAFVELIDASGRSVARSKVLLEEGNGSGMFVLPDTLPTGIYHLIAYTSWLRNFGEGHFSISGILVVRPGDEFKTSQGAADDKAESGKKAASEEIVFQMSKSLFQTREKVKVKLSLQDTGSAIAAVAIRRKEPLLNNYSATDFPQFTHPEVIDYLPDYKGILLSGYVRNKQNKEPLAKHEIYLSFPGENVEIKRTVSGDEGKFRFLLNPETGVKDLVFSLQSENAGIWLDEHFARNAGLEFTGSLFLDKNQEDYFTEKFINRQLQEKFDQSDTAPAPVNDTVENYIFYSNPYQVLKPENYIELDSLHEYFYELIPTVHIKRRNKAYQMYLTNPETNYSVGDHPALFIDGVYYPYPGELMKLDVKKIERIEVIPEVYYYRRMAFDGIVSVFTKNRQFMDVPMQPNMYRIFYQPADEFPEFNPKNYSENTTDPNIPDLRWLLHWQPRVEIEKDNPAVIQFYTGDLKGEFEISVTGIGHKGETIKSHQNFRVE
ncbi:MAG: hypothetical protein ACOCVA_04400 [Prolixibacteraceae bacterium]